MTIRRSDLVKRFIEADFPIRAVSEHSLLLTVSGECGYKWPRKLS